MIDSHVHVWTIDPARYPWQPTLAHVPVPTKPAIIESLLSAMDEAGVSVAVLVQPSVYGWDNAYLCDALVDHPARFVGVCLVDARATDAAEKLRYWCAERGCRGMRLNIIGDRDASWLLAPALKDLWRAARELGASISLQMRPDQVDTVGRLARSEPDLVFVADYLGAEAFRDNSGIDAVTKLGRLPNLWMKLLCVAQDSRSPYPYRDLWPVYERALAAFGPRRLVFGTDFPYLVDFRPYRDGIDWLNELPFLGPSEREFIAEANARILWRLDADPRRRT